MNKTLTNILDDIPRLSPDIEIVVIDLFCGAGGYSWGVENAKINGRKVAKVLLCCNHDALAIESHYANMPEALHMVEDIRTVSMEPFRMITEQVRLHRPHIKVLLHASLECTNHSKAKGGMSRDADSRTLADHLFRYIETIRPDYISIENVEEFMIWGPLQTKVIKDKTTGQELYSPLEVKRNKKSNTVAFVPVWIPVPERKAEYYDRWVKQVQAHGYTFEHRLLNSADFGAYTARKRFFGMFALPHLPIVWPEATHAKSPQPQLFEQKKRWKPVCEVLSLHIQGESIFARKKPLVEATLERILAGCIKFVAGGKEEFLVKYNSMSQRRTYLAPGVDDPCPVVSTQGRLGLAQVDFLQRYNSGSPMDKCISADQPCGVVTTANRFSYVQPQFISKQFSGHPESKNRSIEAPAGAITCIDHHALVSPEFLSKYYSGTPHNMVSSIDVPAPTIRTKDGAALISPEFLSAYYGNGHNHSILSPSPTVTTKDRLAYVQPIFLDNHYGNGYPTSLETPSGTLTQKPKQSIVSGKWILNPQYSSKGGSIDAPCFTIIARMDKQPPYLMSAETSGEIAPFIKKKNGVFVYEIYPDDSPAMVQIKEFMALYGLTDIKMRMLLIDELKRIMGLPTDYILRGSQTNQKKFIGNAVETTQARVNIEALVLANNSRRINKTA